MALAAAAPTPPRPDLTRFEPGVREVLAEGLASFDEAASSDAPGVRAEAWGRLGMLYQAHHLQDLAALCYREAVALAPDVFRWRYLLGFSLQEQGDFEGAEAAYDAALALAADDVNALLRRGQTRAELGRNEAAAADFRRVLSLEPQHAAALAGLGRIALAERRYEDAIDALGRVLELDPRADRLHYPLAMAWRARGDVARARDHMARAGETDVALRDPILAEMSGLTRSAQIYLEAGYAAARAGRDREAVAQFEKAAAFNPDDPAAQLGLGQGLTLLGDYAAAEAAFDRAVALAPDDPVARYRRGTLYTLTGRDERAVEELTLALAADPGHLQAGLRLADALMRLGRYPEADDAYGRLAPPPEAEALILYRRGLARLAAGDCDGGAGLLEAALARRPSSGEIMQAVARTDATCAGADAARRARALTLARQLFAARPDAAHAETLAMAMAANGDSGAAVELQAEVLAAAGSASPDWPAALLERYRAGLPAERPWPDGHPVFHPGAGGASPDSAADR